MPGLVGVANARGISRSDALLTRMLCTIQSQDWHRVDRASDPANRWAIGRVDLGFGRHEAQPAHLPELDVQAFVNGRFHLDPDERRALSGQNTPDEMGDGEWLLHVYEQHGGELPSGLRGSFAAALVDAKRQRIVIVNDTVGQRPIYYSFRAGQLIFGSTVHAILQDETFSRRIDYESLSDLLEYRYVLGEKTLFQDVSLLAPGERLFYDLKEGQLKVDKDDSLDEWFSVGEDTRPDQVVLDELAELFSQATDRICDPELINTVSLSGGMDSRAIMSVIRPDRFRMHAFTAGFRGGVDKGITSRIARAAKCPASFSGWDSDFLAEESYLRLTRDAIALTDGMRGSSYHPMTKKLAEDFQGFDLKIVLTGHGGEFAKLDHAYGFSLNVDTDLKEDPDEIKDLVFSKMRGGIWEGVDRRRIFKGDLASIQDEALRASFEREFSKIDASLPIEQQLSYFFLREYFRKHAVLSNRIHGNFSEIEYPFIAEDFVRAVLKTPLRLRLNHNIHRHIIRTFNPALLRIPVSDSRVRLDASKWERLLITRPYGLLRRFGFFEADVPETLLAKKTLPEAFANTLLDARCLDRGTLDGDYLGEILERFGNGEHRLFHALNGLLALELWSQLYLDGAN